MNSSSDENAFVFSADNPFPLLKESLIFRQATKQHAKEVDKFLGFQINDTEREVKAQRHSPELSCFETWAHIDPQVFLTSYIELRYILSLLPIVGGDAVMDLGCAYARIPFVLARHHASSHFHGYDCVPHRILETQRIAELHKLQNVHLECRDISASEFQIPHAQHFFIYDTGTTSDVEKILDKLKEVICNSECKTKSLVARGARVANIFKNEHPWLPQATHSNQNFSVYLF